MESEIVSITMDKLTALMRELMDVKEKRGNIEKGKMNMIIPKFGGKKEESFEEYLFKVLIWRKVTKEKEKTKIAQIINGLFGLPLEIIMSLKEEDIWKENGLDIIINNLKERYFRSKEQERYIN